MAAGSSLLRADLTSRVVSCSGSCVTGAREVVEPSEPGVGCEVDRLGAIGGSLSRNPRASNTVPVYYVDELAASLAMIGASVR